MWGTAPRKETMSKCRITSLNMSVQQIVLALAGGNPGAIRVTCEIVKDGARIDPDSGLGALGPLFSLDRLGIFESQIWKLYSDVCDCDLTKTLCLLRAEQLGHLSEEALKHAIDNRGEGIDHEAILQKVREVCPRFAMEEAIAE